MDQPNLAAPIAKEAGGVEDGRWVAAILLTILLRPAGSWLI
jgi:hypothetical protein